VLFKEAGRRWFISRLFIKQSQDFNSGSTLQKMGQAAGTVSHNTTPNGIKVNRSDAALHCPRRISLLFQDKKMDTFHWIDTHRVHPLGIPSGFFEIF
jgi:hypothetical protein